MTNILIKIGLAAGGFVAGVATCYGVGRLWFPDICKEVEREIVNNVETEE